MVWEQDKLHLQLLEVLYLEEESVVMRTRARPFYALSLRTRGDTEIALSEKSIQLGERDLALFSPNIAYTRYSRDDSKYVFHFSMQTQEYRTDKSPEIEILHDFRYDILLPLFVEACRIWNNRESGYHIRCTAILYTIFAEIRENLLTDPHRHSPLVEEALRYLDSGYQEKEMTVAALAKQLHISTTYLRNIFLKELSITPKSYITMLRMNRAQSLLNTGYYTIAGVAEQVGFGDPKNFTTAYKKYFGYPPSSQRYEDFK